jgi:Xaa-Pro aminopeptidase
VYPHQTERLTGVLERAGLSALVASAPANVLYVTGFDDPLPPGGGQRFAVFSRNGTALVAPADAIATIVAERVDVGHVVAHGRGGIHTGARRGGEGERIGALLAARAPTAAEALAAALAALDVASGTIGLDEGAVTPFGWRTAVDGLRGVSVVPGAGHFRSARRVKGPYELECLQRALAIAEESLDVVLQTLKPGTTEREAFTAWQIEVIRRGATPLPGVIVAGSRAWIPAAAPSDRAMRAREVVRFDLGCAFKGYRSSVARTAVMGEPDERQQRVHGALEAAVDAAIAALKPGAPAAAIHRILVAAARAEGLPDFGPHRVGRAIGLEFGEDPELGPDVDAALEMGEILCLEAAWFDAGREGFSLRETVLVTRVGAHVVNRSVRGLVALD